ncbi:MAG: hypothetical protein WBV94_14800 [Blastocatellia bacterium]
MFEQSLKWLQKNWWGLIVAHFIVLISTYLLIWEFAEPIGIPDTIDHLPSFTKTRIFFHMVLTLLIAAYLTLILDLLIRFKKEISLQNPDAGKYLLEKIGFGTNHTSIESCWKISENEIPTEPNLKPFNDGFQGKVLQVRSASRYAADYKVKPQASLGTLVEIVARFDDSSAHLYTQLSVLTKDRSESSTLWLNLKIGEGKPKLVWSNESSCEWYYYIKPAYLDGNWLNFQINLVIAVDDTMGSNGWRFGELKRCRLRGNLSLAYIGVYAQK